MMSQTAPAIRGMVNALNPLQIRGWAVAPLFPDQHLQIEARLDGVWVGSAIASVALGPPNGDHGFVVDVLRELPSDAMERLEITATRMDGARARLGFAKALGGALRPESVGMGGVPAREDRPAFILGSARSGTTAMTQAMREFAQYDGFGEGHLFTLLPKLLQTVHGHYASRFRERAVGIDTMLARVPQPVMDHALRLAFATIASSLFSTSRWLEKTPGPDMIRAAPQLRLAWPHARFVFMKRHPVPNIESRRRKFPAVSFNDHCKLWADCMTAWEDARPALEGCFVEIDQLQLAERPAEAVTALSPLLDLDPDQAAGMVRYFTNRFPQRTSEVYGPPPDPRAIGWSDEQIAVFQAVCGPVMARFGYAGAG